MHNEKYCVKCKTTTGVSDRPYVTIRGKGYYFCKFHNNARKKAHYDRVKSIVFKHYGNKCACCGEKEFLFLTIDHINNDGSKHLSSTGKRIAGVRLYCEIRTLGFPKVYQLLCMNCNFGKRMNNGVCPHNANVV